MFGVQCNTGAASPIGLTSLVKPNTDYKVVAEYDSTTNLAKITVFGDLETTEESPVAVTATKDFGTSFPVDITKVGVGAGDLDGGSEGFDFSGDGQIESVIVSPLSVVATPLHGAVCSADGLSIDGVDDYADVTSFEFGGTTSFEVYVKYDSFNSASRVYDFGSGASIDN
ncbi:hypothetical protein TrLO_g6501, partial [Triparma laevis f. longispina]